MDSLGRTIRRARKDAGLTQKQLAGAIGCDVSYPSHLEAGRKTPSLETLHAIAKVTGLKVVITLERSDIDVLREMRMIRQGTDRMYPVAAATLDRWIAVLEASGGSDE